jgi:hypothetical protein
LAEWNEEALIMKKQPKEDGDCGAERPRYRLWLPQGTMGGGFLIMPHDGDGEPVCKLQPRLVKVLIVLNEAYEADQLRFPRAPQVRGWRSYEALANAINLKDPLCCPLDPEAVMSYVNIIKRLVRKEVAAHSQALSQLLEQQRQIGVRLLRAIEIIDEAPDRPNGDQ